MHLKLKWFKNWKSSLRFLYASELAILFESSLKKICNPDKKNTSVVFKYCMLGQLIDSLLDQYDEKNFHTGL